MLIKIFFVLTLSLTLSCHQQIKKDGFMTDREIEQLMAKGDGSFLTNESIKSIEFKEYNFVKKYINSNNRDVRNVALIFCNTIAQPWCFDNFIKALYDPIISHRSIAAEGIFKLSPKDKKEKIYENIHSLFSEGQNGSQFAVDYLILTIGNIGNETDIQLLLEMKEKYYITENLQQAYQKALAKLGHKKSFEEIQDEIQSGNPRDKWQALWKIEYINNPVWVPIVKPLLLDESIASSWQKGRGKIRYDRRVCDFALSTLKRIDPENKIPYDFLRMPPYKDEEIQHVRELYGVTQDNTKQED